MNATNHPRMCRHSKFSVEAKSNLLQMCNLRMRLLTMLCFRVDAVSASLWQPLHKILTVQCHRRSSQGSPGRYSTQMKSTEKHQRCPAA